MRTEQQARKDFASGEIPPGYAKVLDIGPEGQTNEPRIMPADIACRDWEQLPPKPNQRVVIIPHPFGTTAIYWDEEAGAVRPPEAF